MSTESSGKPDAGKLARPVWGWGRGATPRPTPPSRSRWSRDQVEESAGQLLLYSELVRSLAPRKRLRLQFAVLTKAKQPALDLHEVPADRQRIDRTKRIVERVWKAIEAGSFYPAPSPMSCPICPFRQPCRGWTG